jgi:hypothetical protein
VKKIRIVIHNLTIANPHETRTNISPLVESSKVRPVAAPLYRTPFQALALSY